MKRAEDHMLQFSRVCFLRRVDVKVLVYSHLNVTAVINRLGAGKDVCTHQSVYMYKYHLCIVHIHTCTSSYVCCDLPSRPKGTVFEPHLASLGEFAKTHTSALLQSSCFVLSGVNQNSHLKVTKCRLSCGCC